MNILTIVTGASQGIGKACSELLIKGGSSVLGIARNESLLKEIQQQYSNFHYIVADISDDNKIEEIIVWVKNNQFDQINLVNNAGLIEPLKPISELTRDELTKIFNINVISLINLTTKLLPYLKEGRIINLSSGASIKPTSGWSAYCMSKAAINMFSQALALEHPKIFNLALRPGVVDTEMQNEIRTKGVTGMSKVDHEKFNNLKVNNQLLSPYQPGEVIANIILSKKLPWELNGKFISWDSDELKNLV
ncbi:NAD(P)-binding protein [Neoconidiobolus thromboides FSU 785]|nr:NAD(P)-binding protein [Neoconidiobolus thromboides FSU 785]